jgi:outer membrane protein assembly factor BamA
VRRAPLAAGLALACGGAAADDAAGRTACPALAELEAQGAVIRAVDVRQLPIFDDEPDLPSLYRWADRLHVDSRDSAIASHLLFRAGDRVSERRIEETLRNLRELRYIREPSVRALDCRDGAATLVVSAREVWTTNPGLSFGRAGGENSGGVKLEELNVLGLGKQLSFEVASDPERNSVTLHWRDPDVAGSRWVDDFAFRDSDDGQGWSVMLERPFYSLDSRWSTGLTVQRDETVEPVYRLGEKLAAYGRRSEFGEIRFGRSAGLQDGWVRRTVFGLRREHAEFGAAPGENAPALLPEDRRLDYPFVRFEAVQDDFDTTLNRDQIARTEDRQFGLHYALELGWSAPALGADRDAALVHADVGRGWRLRAGDTMFAGAGLTGRVEGGSTADVLFDASLRYYHPTGPNGVFFAGFQAAAGHALDGDHELSIGGDSGLRGYPLHYQAGSGTALVTLEQRIYTKYSLWKLADVGAAVFFDAGRAFGRPTLGPAEDFGLLKDVGFGLRLGSTRSALGNVLHIDLAFPLDGDSSIDDVQLLVQTKRSF